MTGPTKRTLLAVLAVATLHAFLYLALFASLFARFDTGQATPTALSLLVSILGFPMMWLMARLPAQWIPAFRSVLGDDSNTLFVFAGLNALLWGAAMVALRHRVTSPARSVPAKAA